MRHKLQTLTTRWTKYLPAYDIFMSILAVGIVVTLIADTKVDDASYAHTCMAYFDRLVWLLFTCDYIVRWYVAENRFKFMRNNIVDLVAIIPFDVIFQTFRAVRLVRLLFLIRVFAYLNRAYKRIGQVLHTNDFDHVLWFTFCTIFIGAISISVVEDMTVGDAIWWSFVTMTTVGYGDIAPTSTGGRIIAVCLMLVGVGFISMLTSTISAFFVKSEHKKLTFEEEELALVTRKLQQFEDLTLSDIDDIYLLLRTLKSQNTKEKEELNICTHLGERARKSR